MKYSKEQKDFILCHYKGISTQELTELFNQVFSTNISTSTMKSYKSNNKLSSGISTRFEKGHVPYSKGKKWNEIRSIEAQQRCKLTCFKKGNIPLNHKPIGSERVNIYGYREIKVGEPNKWKLKHRLVWEKEKGEIPPGYMIKFLDGNKLNCHISNLILITQRENFIMNRKGLVYNNPECTQSALLVAKLIIQTHTQQRR